MKNNKYNTKSLLALLLLFSITLPSCKPLFINKYDNEGNRKGLWKHYWDEEKHVQRKGRYKHGKEIKTWKYYNIDGALVKKEKYNKNRDSITITNYYPKRKIESTGKACLINENDSTLHFYWTGLWKFYDKNGNLNHTELYERGRKISTQKISK
ncbi:MAG TPA: hypothetical protein PKN14_08585 [Bacteroidia bacterium]|nr:hypothetical protein [Bacteroidetes bacterium CHB6]HNR49294.1 hypothetical protein [Bacteroidia bacterium]HNT82896.1 hypothetical protein [Bacteroidia bacterium]